MFESISIGCARLIIMVGICSLFSGAFHILQKETQMGATLTLVLGLLAVAAIVIVAILTRNSKDDSAMPVLQRWVLVSYLLILGIALVNILGVLASLDFPDTSAIVSGASIQQSVLPSEGPALRHISVASTPGGTSDIVVILYGQRFDAAATVSVNSQQRRAETIESGTILQARIQQTELAGKGSLIIEVTNPDKKTSNAITLPVTKPVALVEVLHRSFFATRELQLLLLVICAGALGSYLHAIRSLTDFIGNRTVVASWFWWYIARPFVGMSMALIFYAVLRGGFLAGTPADAKVVNPFGVIAIGALVGMFADKAAQKLAEVFDTLFKAEDTRKDRLTSPVVDKIQPDHVRPATTPPPEISITGAHLSTVEKVRINQQDRVPRSVDDKAVKIVLTPADVAQASEITVALVDKSGTVTSAGTVFVTDLDITAPANSPAPDKLVAGNHGQAYSQTFGASGGTGPYSWQLLDSVPGLQIKPNGELAGTPPAVGDFTINVKVMDSKKASVTRAFKLRID
jgi:hypothetical protein